MGERVWPVPVVGVPVSEGVPPFVELRLDECVYSLDYRMPTRVARPCSIDEPCLGNALFLNCLRTSEINQHGGPPVFYPEVRSGPARYSVDRLTTPLEIAWRLLGDSPVKGN